ncbi:nitroreductase family deazaflavin-dependent oxidoreductase [Gordonia sp. PKS22-38]|uniref:Nitroreductase family deazaflavin-dependent oxidoreductase n=1 Tax=Gordonia prachuapensis TaxID=3115651 RepID=A0ABU7MXA8_9ACTN|nr:nitroreductase family deazaflavin-dependent oxidoreductase [Gordonia sp. PKS22-38]
MSLSLWFQRKMNAYTTGKLRRKGKPQMMGMDMLILHTTGRRSGAARETPISWFAAENGARLLVASGGGKRNPDWYANLMAHPESAEIELPDGKKEAVTPVLLDGADRDHAWQRITDEQPRYAKYAAKSDREYPLVKLVSR